MAEDAMLIYRVTRAPERRVFYIDVANVPPKDVDPFIQKARDALKRTPNVKSNGSIDMRFNPESILEDFFIPVRGDRSSRIETLPGGDNASAIEDIQYLQNKLFIALGVPKSYLTAEEDLSGKSTLAQEDIKFARTIQRIQKIVVSELAKIGLIHLHLKGYDEADIYNFDLKLTNPSSVTELMQLELIERRLSIAEQMANSILYTNEYAQKNVLKLTDSEIAEMRSNITKEAEDEFKLDQIKTGGMNDPEFQMQMAQGGVVPPEEGEYEDEESEAGDIDSGESKNMRKSDYARDKTAFPYDPTGTKHLKGYPDLESSVNTTFDNIYDDNDQADLIRKRKKSNTDNLLNRTISDIKRHDRSVGAMLSKLKEDKSNNLLGESTIKDTNFVKNE
jgi:hypothetical protein